MNQERSGEELATEFLRKKGYKILERNFEASQGEIDIIAKDDEELVFVEVKTRTDMSYGEGAEAVTPIKLQHLLNSIKYYIYKRNLQDEFIRIDIIEVYIKQNNVKINHIKKAVL